MALHVGSRRCSPYCNAIPIEICTKFRLHKVALTPEAKKELLARALGNTGTGGGGAFVIDAMAFQMG